MTEDEWAAAAELVLDLVIRNHINGEHRELLRKCGEPTCVRALELRRHMLDEVLCLGLKRRLIEARSPTDADDAAV